MKPEFFPGHAQTAWGAHSISQATRLLLRAALENPLNQRFMLLCGSSIPLRPAQFTYSQLIAEKRSRFDKHLFTREENQVSTLFMYALYYPVATYELMEGKELILVLHNMWTIVTGYSCCWLFSRLKLP